MAACLPPLGDDDIGASSPRCSSLISSANGDEDDCPCFMGLVDEGVCVAPKERDDSHAGCKGRGEPFMLIPRQSEIDTEGTVCAPTGLTDDRSDVVRRRPGERQHPEPTGLRD